MNYKNRANDPFTHYDKTEKQTGGSASTGHKNSFLTSSSRHYKLSGEAYLLIATGYEEQYVQSEYMKRNSKRTNMQLQCQNNCHLVHHHLPRINGERTQPTTSPTDHSQRFPIFIHHASIMLDSIRTWRRKQVDYRNFYCDFQFAFNDF